MKIRFEARGHVVHALNGASYEVGPAQMVGLVGESGSGKSISGLSIMGLLPANAHIESGEIYWRGRNLLSLSEKELRKVRGSEIGLIFQNPLAALNPVFSIGNQMIETICLHHPISKQAARKMAIDYLDRVKIPDPDQRIDQYPHEFSLGMCQRIMIALTLSMRPNLIIADEPTASLDVTIQAEIMHLLQDIKKEFNLSILFISHDLSVVAEHCDYIYVMHKGQVVESGNSASIFGNPQDAYTKRLISSIPQSPKHRYTT